MDLRYFLTLTYTYRANAGLIRRLWAWFWELEEVFVVFFAHILNCFLEVNGGFDQQAFVDLDNPLFVF